MSGVGIPIGKFNVGHSAIGRGSGPPYPRTSGGGTPIGEFIIGISAIGGGEVFDFWDTVLSQYANSPILTQLISNFAGYLDPSANLDAFFDLVWNVDTAQGYGLDVWGRIVGVSRVIQLPAGSYFGMEGPTGASGTPFQGSAFYNGAKLTNNYSLTDDAYRQLILAKALANISDGSIAAINQLLINLFGLEAGANCYVIDNLDMTVTYQFDFTPTPVQKAIITQSGVLPTPTGVQATATFP